MVNIIKLISNKDLEKLISKGVIGMCHAEGNNSFGKHSCGYYDVAKYRQMKKETPEASDRYLKTIATHVGVVKTRNKTYIEDSYLRKL